MPHPTRSWFVEPTKAFNNADVDTLRRLFADTTIFREPGHSPISGDIMCHKLRNPGQAR
jgi:hypothetical protein